jgi:PPOX class probable F420-dependent enzyme
MASGSCDRLADLPPNVRWILETEPRGVLSTIDPRGRPHSVPIIFAIDGEDMVTPIDRKPKTGRLLGRLRNLARDPTATLLVDRWSDEWTDLAWVMIRGRASLQDAARSARETEAIIARYPRYRSTIEGSDVIRLSPDGFSWWSWE